ncbi:MAG: flagellar protein FlgN [Chromatiales bacterium]|nr:flagellar protein FlgN [Chromatiales bacterium]
MEERVTTILGMIQDELQQLEQLGAVLQKEHLALQRRDTSALNSATSEKDKLVAALRSRGRARMELLITMGVATDQQSIQCYVASMPQLMESWQMLERSLLECQKQNQINGMLLEKGRKQTQSLLALFLGDQMRKAETYDARGYTSSLFNGRSVRV